MTEPLSDTFSTVATCPQCSKENHYLFSKGPAPCRIAVGFVSQAVVVPCCGCGHRFVDNPLSRF